MLTRIKQLWMKITGLQAAYMAGIDEGRAQAKQNAKAALKDTSVSRAWSERWYGSGPNRGWHIRQNGEDIVYIGPMADSREVAELVHQHNLAIAKTAESACCGK